MNENMNLGLINGHAVGRILKEAVRRATVVIRNEKAVFEATAKMGYSGSMTDVFTSADTKAQEVYLRTFRECFPYAGVIGEENELRIQPTHGCTAYFTVDPLDGTKAYVRRQSHGVATMVALIDQGHVLSAYIGDINTEEVYGYRPGSSRVHRITRQDTFEEMQRLELMYPGDSYALLRDPPSAYSEATRKRLQSFKNYEVMGSSIGTWAARLWKGEVAALFIPPGFETPWDSSPMVGITKKMGFVYLRPKDPTQSSDSSWELFEPGITPKIEHRAHDVMIVHSKDVASVM